MLYRIISDIQSDLVYFNVVTILKGNDDRCALFDALRGYAQ